MNQAIKSPIILIPARLASQRLPNKPLALIAGVPMIIRVWRLAQAAAELCDADVLVAAGDKEIVEAVEAEGGAAILTDPALPSGSDRIFAALNKIDNSEKYDAIINLQGDLPLFDPQICARLLAALKTYPITTPVIEIDEHDAQNPHFVKAVLADETQDISRAIYFSRAAVPAIAGGGSGKFFGHIGIYAYRRAALEKFIAAPPAALEVRESLEQLRAIANNIDIGAIKLDKNQMPMSVDTKEDISEVEKLLNETNK